MQRLTWDVMRGRAKDFAAEWADATYEKGETQSFYNDFFAIFGVQRRSVASYEKRVQTLDKGRAGFIDLFWPGTLLVEQKSAGLDLGKARAQALTYVDWLPDRDQPRYVLTCDFQRWRLLDLETGTDTPFTLRELPKHIERFDFILGRQRTFTTQAEVNIKAAELMGRLHDALEARNYTGHDLERLLVRLLFCLFADDTGIFEPKDIFLQLIDHDTRPDGGDTGRVLVELFDILDTPEGQRQAGLSAELGSFPYVNGDLFKGHVRTPVFDAAMREMLLDAARFNWSKVSPAIFGSLFQSVMDKAERRAKGAHYTSEANILKVIEPLFVDDLRAELAAIVARRTGREAMLREFQHKLARINLLDPACGCGNFLVVAYRELRALELATLEALYPRDAASGLRQGFTDLSLLAQVDVGQCHGIEYEEFPARIAEVAMWMADHLCNREMAAAFAQTFARIPLKQSANIRHGDALEIDWAEVLPPGKCSFVMGNPPFVGAKFQTAEQRAQVRRIAGLPGSGGTLDYVCAWFIKAVDYLSAPLPLAGGVGGGSDATASDAASVTDRPPPAPPASGRAAGNRRARIGFVATNSISQGEQVAQLWPLIFRAGWEIAFAHRSFVWDSEARGKAHVHVVVVGLAHRDAEPDEKRLFSYHEGHGVAEETQHGALTAYLFAARSEAVRHLVVRSENRPINGAKRLLTGTQPLDGDIYKFTGAEKTRFLDREPGAAKYFRPYIGAEEFIQSGERYIIDLESIDPNVLSRLPDVLKLVERVKRYRAASSRLVTLNYAEMPTKYGISVKPLGEFLVIPQVSSERRDYVPIAALHSPTIPSEKLRVLLDANNWDFGILTSRMHMAWMRAITGRMKSDYMYSVSVVYNTFPWPDATEPQRAKIAVLADTVLAARANHPTASLAILYDPLTMPGDLRAAHAALDRAVDRLYRADAFASDRDRVEHLFGRYAALIDPLATIGVKANRRTAKRVKSGGAGSARAGL